MEKLEEMDNKELLNRLSNISQCIGIDMMRGDFERIVKGEKERIVYEEEILKRLK
jgi:hypothetical protein